MGGLGCIVGPITVVPPIVVPAVWPMEMLTAVPPTATEEARPIGIMGVEVPMAGAGARPIGTMEAAVPTAGVEARPLGAEDRGPGMDRAVVRALGTDEDIANATVHVVRWCVDGRSLVPRPGSLRLHPPRYGSEWMGPAIARGSGTATLRSGGGVKNLKFTVPAWIDMQSGSSYLKRIFARGRQRIRATGSISIF